mgnify:FL=1
MDKYNKENIKALELLMAKERALQDANPEETPEKYNTLVDYYYNKNYKNTNISNKSFRESLNNIYKYKNTLNIIPKDTKSFSRKNNKYKEIPHNKESQISIMQQIVAPLIDRTTQKTNTSKQLTKTAIQANSLLGEVTQMYNRNSVNPRKVEAIKEQLEKAKSVIYFDTETLGGVDETGQQIISDITDLSYVETFFENGKINNKTHKYFWGITNPKQWNVSKNSQIGKDNYYKRIVENYANGLPIETGKDKITLKRLALFGHPNTTIKNHEIIDFATEEDLNGVLDIKDIKKGLEKLTEEYEYQLDNKKNGIMPWEKEFVNLINDTVVNNDAVITGNNIDIFDMPAIKQFTQNLSPEATKELNKILGNRSTNDLLQNRTIDVLPLFRNSFGNDITTLYTTEQLVDMRNNGLTPFQLEALKKLLPQDLLDGNKSHTSDFDTEVGSALLFTPLEQLNVSNKFLENYKSYNNMWDILTSEAIDNIDEAKALQKGQMFLANKTIGSDDFLRNKVFAFSTNELTDIVKGADNIILNAARESEDRGFGNYSFTSGMPFTLEDYGYINLDKETKKLFEPYSFMDGEDQLYYSIFKSSPSDEQLKRLGINPNSKEAKIFKEYNVIVGPKTHVEKAMSD